MAVYQGLLSNPNLRGLLQSGNIRQAKEQQVLAPFRGAQAARIPAGRPIVMKPDNSLSQGLSSLGTALKDIGKMRKETAAGEELAGMYAPATQVTENMTGPEAMAMTPDPSKLLAFAAQNPNTPAATQAMTMAEKMQAEIRQRQQNAFQLQRDAVSEKNANQRNQATITGRADVAKLNTGELSIPKAQGRFMELLNNTQKGPLSPAEKLEFSGLQFLLEKDPSQMQIQTPQGPQTIMSGGRKVPKSILDLVNKPPAAAGSVPQPNNAQPPGNNTGATSFNTLPNNASQPQVQTQTNQQPLGKVGEPTVDEERQVYAAKVNDLSPKNREIFEQNETDIQTNDIILNTIDRALGLTDAAYSGPTAKLRTSIGEGISEVGRFINKDFKMPEVDASLEYDALIKDLGLDQVKARVGGAPSEKEVSMIVDIQGSISLTPTARKKVLLANRAKALKAKELAKKQQVNILKGQPFASNEVKTAADITPQSIMKMDADSLSNLGANINDMTADQLLAIQKRLENLQKVKR